jgi:hypothetical protein
MEKYKDIILYLTFFITSIVFPLWVSTFAVKRGRPGWSKVAFFSILGGLGFFGGVAALIASSLKPGIIQRDELEITSDAAIEAPIKEIKEKPLPRGMCPKCNSNMVQRTVMIEDPVTKQRINAMNQERLTKNAGGVMVLFGILVFGYTFFLFLTRNYSLGYLAAAGVGVYFAYLGARPWLAQSQEEGKIVLETYACRKCRHTWDGDQLPH